jgi:CRISPR type III-A-associated RAMP protein Csm5
MSKKAGIIEKEAGIIELEVLTPLFIKGKDPDYGEGIYIFKSEETAYLLDNDQLCKFIYNKTYDGDGNYLNEGQDYVAWYLEFMKLDTSDTKIVESYNSFIKLAELNVSPISDKSDIPDRDKFKGKSVQYFLDKLGLLGKNKKDEIRNLSMGITTLMPSGYQKRFIQNGRGEYFLPGSSIKGAVRNALLWKMLSADPELKFKITDFINDKFEWCATWVEAKKSKYAKELQGLSSKQREKKLEIYEKGKRKDFASRFSRKDDNADSSLAQNSLDSITFSNFFPKLAGDQNLYSQKYIDNYNKHWEKASEIHRDLFRIVRITDAKFIKRPVCQYVNVETYNLKGTEFEKRDKTGSELETVAKNTKAWFRISIDKELAKEFFGEDVPPYLQSIDALLQTVKEFFLTVAAEELAFYKKATHPGPAHDVMQWYKDLLEPAEAVQPEESSLFRLGWGGGMMSKTQFLHLKTEDRKRARDLMNYRDEPVAPQSRYLQVSGEKAIRPLGWCRLRYLGRGMDEAVKVMAKAESEAEAERQASAHAPAGCVRATIVYDQSQPVQVRIDEGDYKNTKIKMTGMKLQQLQNLQLKQDSVVFVKPVEQRGGNGKRQLMNVTYIGKP